MESFFTWLTANPWAANIAVVLLVTLALAVIATCVVALRQGRELQLWPPKLGALPPSPSPGSSVQKPNGDLVAYDRFSNALDNKAPLISAAKREVWMIGATMHYTMNNQDKLIIEQVRSGLDFYLLVADPDGVDYEANARCFGQSGVRLRKETEMTLDACVEISKRLKDAGDTKGSFHVKLLDLVFTAGVYFFDPQEEDALMFLVPHVPGHDAPVSPGFKFRRIDGGLLDDYFKLYKGIWNSTAKPFVAPMHE